MNLDQLEDDVRAAFAAHADEIPVGAAERVRTHDYRPRTRTLRPPIAVGGVTAAAATGAAVWLFALSSQTSTAFAGWTAAPTTAPAGQVTTAESTCQSRVAALPSPPTGGSDQSAPSLNLAGLTPVLSDTRGPFTWVILANGDASSYASCITGPSLTTVSADSLVSPSTGGGVDGSSSGTGSSVPAGQIRLYSSSHASTSNDASYSFAEGRVGNGVTDATLVLSDGTHVEATIQNGWFAAWWPGDRTVSSALVTTASGTTTEQIPASASSCPQPPAGSRGTCTGGFSLGRTNHASGSGESSIGSWESNGSTASTGAGSTATAPTSGS
jgi:hypothetical protein